MYLFLDFFNAKVSSIISSLSILSKQPTCGERVFQVPLRFLSSQTDSKTKTPDPKHRPPCQYPGIIISHNIRKLQLCRSTTDPATQPKENKNPSCPLPAARDGVARVPEPSPSFHPSRKANSSIYLLQQITKSYPFVK